MVHHLVRQRVTHVLSVLTMAVAGQANAQVPQAGKQAPPPPRAIPGITAPDQFPQGCVDCHLNYPDGPGDTRLSTIMKRWYSKVDTAIVTKVKSAAPKNVVLKGKHPMAQGALRDIPAGCLTCHKKGSTMAPPLAQMAHLIHLTGGKDNPFLTQLQGECTHCHKLNPSTGQWSIPSGPEK